MLLFPGCHALYVFVHGVQCYRWHLDLEAGFLEGIKKVYLLAVMYHNAPPLLFSCLTSTLTCAVGWIIGGFFFSSIHWCRKQLK